MSMLLVNTPRNTPWNTPVVGLSVQIYIAKSVNLQQYVCYCVTINFFGGGNKPDYTLRDIWSATSQSHILSHELVLNERQSDSQL